jgi:hypothetical protein
MMGKYKRVNIKGSKQKSGGIETRISPILGNEPVNEFLIPPLPKSKEKPPACCHAAHTWEIFDFHRKSNFLKNKEEIYDFQRKSNFHGRLSPADFTQVPRGEIRQPVTHFII